jgi:spoIIIJ-associated protein
MFDRKQEANEFVGESLSDATASAVRFFGVDASELKVSVAPGGSVYGAGGRTVVVAHLKSRQAPRPGDGGRDDEPRGREREGRGRGRGDRGGDRDRGRDRGDRGDRGDRDRGARKPREARPEPASAPAEVAAVESKGTKRGDVGPVGDFVLGVIERMALGHFEISEAAEDDFLVYQIRGVASEQLGGGDGRAIDALQLLANQASKQLLDEGPRVVIDIEGETADREDSLTRLAARAAARAIEAGRAVALDPMNGRDRRIIHVALRDEAKIATMSIGTGRYRQVVVVPEGAPEYDEALEASKSVNS